MIFFIDLFKLPGAEAAKLDGVEGVFIPKIPNLSVVKFRKRYYAFLRGVIEDAPGSKKHDYRIMHSVPVEYYNHMITKKEYLSKYPGKLGYADGSPRKRGKAASEAVTAADLEDIISN